MHNITKKVEIPERMKDLRMERGFPVPFVVLVDQEDAVHFKINDDQKVAQCIQFSLCTICGQEMPKEDKWLVGGPESAFHPRGVYADFPVHKECGVYALQVCPYMAYSQYNSKTTVEDIVSKVAGDMAYMDLTQSLDRVPLFAFVRIKGFLLSGPYLVPMRPFAEMQFWFDGKEMAYTEAKKKMMDTSTPDAWRGFQKQERAFITASFETAKLQWKGGK